MTTPSKHISTFYKCSFYLGKIIFFHGLWAGLGRNHGRIRILNGLDNPQPDRLYIRARSQTGRRICKQDEEKVIIYLESPQSLIFRDNCKDIRERSLLGRLPFTNHPNPLSDFVRGKDFKKGKRGFKVIRWSLKKVYWSELFFFQGLPSLESLIVSSRPAYQSRECSRSFRGLIRRLVKSFTTCHEVRPFLLRSWMASTHLPTIPVFSAVSFHLGFSFALFPSK